MFNTVKIFFSLFLGMGLVLFGSGFFSMFFPVFAKKTIGSDLYGLLTSFYYFGFILGALFITRFVFRVGHVRTFILSASLLGISTNLFLYSDHYLIWAFNRFFMGLGYAGIYIVIESWINARANQQNRGKIFATYRILELSSLTIGQLFFIPLKTLSNAQSFSLVTIFTLLSALPLALTLIPQPMENKPLNLNFKDLFGAVPYSTLLMFFIGLTNSCLWFLTPIYLLEQNIVSSEIPIIISFFVLGGVIGQAPVGHFSDRHDRRKVFLFQTFFGALLISGAYFHLDALWLKVLFFFIGMSAMSLYSIIMSYTMDRSIPSEISKVSSQLLFIYSIGAVVGPAICGILLKHFEKMGFSLYIQFCLSSMFILTFIHIFSKESLRSRTKSLFRLLPERTPIYFLFKKNKDSSGTKEIIINPTNNTNINGNTD